MKTAIEKPMTPGGVFDHLMEPQGDEPEFLPSKDPKTMTMQEFLEEMGRFLRWNRMTPEEKRGEQEAQRAASHATEQAAGGDLYTMEPERKPETPQDTVWEDLTDAPQDIVRADVPNGPPDDLQHHGRVEILLHQRGKHLGKQDPGKPFGGELVVKGVGPDVGVLLQDETQLPQDVLPRLLHLLFSIRRALVHKAKGVVGEKAGILGAAVFQLPVHPADTGQRVPEDGFVLRAVEDIVPDAFHRGAQQIGLGFKVIVDAAHRDSAGSSHRTDVNTGPSVLLDEFSADLQNILF